MKTKKILGAAAILSSAALLSTGAFNVLASGGGDAKPDYGAMTGEELAEYLVFQPGNFKLDQPVQEGGTAEKRLVQDELQKTCSALRGKPVDGDTAAKIREMARETIVYPEGGIELGDWRIGRELAWSGFGWRVGHKNDDHSKAENGPGGNCYNCHQLATDRTGGTLGPILTGYGKTRGNSEAVVKYAYEVIYNPHTYFACTNMPRQGAKGLLTQEQISHVLAYLFDPESPVNQ
jgi:sulfur-oxidizing protein SoxX